MTRKNYQELARVAVLTYVIRRWNFLPSSHAKSTYIFFLSPLLLTRSLCYTGLISHKYRKLLVAFSYPECDFRKSDVYQSCETVHAQNNNCSISFMTNFHKTVIRALKMYTQFYCFRSIILALLARRKMSQEFVRKMIKDTCKSIARSTLNISLQSFSQRILLCLAARAHISITPLKLYLLSIIGSLPVLIERRNRVHQFNNFVLSHLVVGKYKNEKSNHLKNILPLIALLSSIALDKGKIDPMIAGVSLITSLSF